MPEINVEAHALAPQMTPQGHLCVLQDKQAASLAPELQQRLRDAFEQGPGHGLLQLGTAEVGVVLPPAWAWWRDFAARYVSLLCASPEGGEIVVATPEGEILQNMIADAPPMTGVEYLSE